MIASLADGESRIENYSSGEDCAATLKCLRQLGVEIVQDATTVVVNGGGKNRLRAPSEPLDCGNSGTTMRLLAGVLAGQEFESVLTGDDSLRKRPMNRVIEPLRQMGAEIESDSGKPPLRIRGRKLKGIDYSLPVASAQVKSCVLLAGLFAEGETVVREKARTRDHTERMLRAFGVSIKASEVDGEKSVALKTDWSMKGREFKVPGDISSAAFFLIAAACLPNSDLTVRNVGVNETRIAILPVLGEVGVHLEIENLRETSGEPFADIHVRGGIAPDDMRMINGGGTVELIDEIPILAIFGTQICGMEVRDARELRVKETDRIAAVVENLRRMNATVDEFKDGFRVERSQLKGAAIDSFGDHRIAMAFAVAGLLAEGETKINGAECADISFPGFFETLESLVKR